MMRSPDLVLKGRHWLCGLLGKRTAALSSTPPFWTHSAFDALDASALSGVGHLTPAFDMPPVEASDLSSAGTQGNNMTTNTQSPPLVTPGAVGGFFEDLLNKLKVAAGPISSDVTAAFEGLVGDAKKAVESTLVAVAPDLDKDVDALDLGLTTAADLFVKAQLTAAGGPVGTDVAAAVTPEMNAIIQSTAATAKAKIDAWAAKASAAAAAAPVVVPAVKPAS
jgi:hypothetical protein